ncbi:DNA-formamidopyrimidine glycosylase [Candidatus Gottesmanbacteria bacterium RIFCSPHIGHO2_02_FULL_40_24]|uniref:DNA-formamidopyrimidine glycosylase n=1 Tax=Candidatus Gottesmanbacteria bacterium RIFCSPHIGHO2_01_FULL_40_15 TaxID=1798376 RepID=A0A1F5Z3L5_9BACT|nr:MAG: DNA-formamidopyrimidine glycosylase [Candidatus Gottesmanbacteria bacterium RIFCSPHIGHO2_01_FULL_40_15]OGG18647.1 MAG: DNA-formamidopyrimidine glycosylase [Candidatus Gottesmanbacteria bacterium RIFCSPHIGHO2_02_FULL_40_24]OGG22808.1 MAG: DNA-formamidopyrimidine glycosylase [Candidatus Gottesmanbacteria bacterium RIFCSPLOWO2_01_FULL_40_10]OGG24958.1 MAG: DNA-formamidopyrimidine glycosylase [Candidatus Gottesmanbacteria bacterium RIFCSPHIGHO2_12_FULL_40_13]
MPELPEVETIKLQLSDAITGLVISQIKIPSEKSFKGDKKLLHGCKITSLTRSGKILIINTNKGLSLAVHLKMTGQLIYESKKQTVNNKQKGGFASKYTRVIVCFTDQSRLIFNDLRKFGWMRLNVLDKGKRIPLKFKGLPFLTDITDKTGPDPFKISFEQFFMIINSSGRPIKLILTDQEKLSGTGNIYANEALFLSKINPNTKANELTKNKAKSLFNCLRKTLKRGIKYGGASDNDYLNAYGEKGAMQEHFQVYGREGEPCLSKCGGVVNRIKQGGRSSFYCPKCQK